MGIITEVLVQFGPAANVRAVNRVERDDSGMLADVMATLKVRGEAGGGMGGWGRWEKGAGWRGWGERGHCRVGEVPARGALAVAACLEQLRPQTRRRQGRLAAAGTFAARRPASRRTHRPRLPPQASPNLAVTWHPDMGLYAMHTRDVTDAPSDGAKLSVLPT